MNFLLSFLKKKKYVDYRNLIYYIFKLLITYVSKSAQCLKFLLLFSFILLYALFHCMNLTFLCMWTVSLHSLMFLTKLSAPDYNGNVVTLEPTGIPNTTADRAKSTPGKLIFYFSFSLFLYFYLLH